MQTDALSESTQHVTENEILTDPAQQTTEQHTDTPTQPSEEITSFGELHFPEEKQ